MKVFSTSLILSFLAATAFGADEEPAPILANVEDLNLFASQVLFSNPDAQGVEDIANQTGSAAIVYLAEWITNPDESPFYEGWVPPNEEEAQSLHKATKKEKVVAAGEEARLVEIEPKFNTEQFYLTVLTYLILAEPCYKELQIEILYVQQQFIEFSTVYLQGLQPLQAKDDLEVKRAVGFDALYELIQYRLARSTRSRYIPGHCGRDHVSCEPVITDSQYAVVAPNIVSVSEMKSAAFSGLVAHADFTMEFINCFNSKTAKWRFCMTDILTAAGLPLPYLTYTLTAFEASVTDEKVIYVKGFPLTVTQVAARFVARSKTSNSAYSGIYTFVVMSIPGIGSFPILQLKGLLDETTPNYLTLSENQVSEAADSTRHLYYYLARLDTGSPNKLQLRALKNFELTINALENIKKANGSLKKLESILGVIKARRTGCISTFTVCNCRIAVGYCNGVIRFLCCQSLQQLDCVVPPACDCNPVAVPVSMQWCCCENTLYVRYVRNVRVPNPVFNIQVIPKSFIRAYKVDADKLEYNGSNSGDSHDDEKGCVEHLYTIKGCNITAMSVCCREGQCAIVYALIRDSDGSNWYLRAYVRGKAVATARLPQSFVIDEKLSYKVDVAAEGRSLAVARCLNRSKGGCKCCKCGVFLPFKVLLVEQKFEFGLVGCLCVRECPENTSRTSEDRY
jgi:hypothetical protein